MTRQREVNNREYFLVGDPRARSKILVGGVFPFSALAASGRICVISLVLRSVSVDRPRERVIRSVMWCLRQESTRLLPNQSNYVQYGVNSRWKSVCPGGTCRQATRDLNAAVRQSNLQVQCDEFPRKSSEQGGTWLPASQRRAKCVPSFQNNWHGQCLGKCLLFSFFFLFYMLLAIC